MTDDELLVADKNADRVFAVVLPSASLMMSAAPIIWAVQIILWLRDGVWTSLSNRDAFLWSGISEPQFRWKGIQQISEWIFGSPLSMTLLIVGGVGLFLFTSWADTIHAEAHAARLRITAKTP